MWPDRTIELAMTHMIAGGGKAERYARPSSVRAMAERVQKWAVVSDVCQSCSSLPAVVLRGGMGLCGRCLANRNQQLGVRDPEGLPPVSVRAEDSQAVELQGLAIVFNSPSEDLGGFTEIIKPVAADRLVTEKPDLRGLWNHNSDLTIARVSAGTMRVEKRTRGVFAAYVPPKWAENYIESVERRDIVGQSFGFFVLDDEWHLENGQPQREIFDMEIIETSPVSFPAYPATTLRMVTTAERNQAHDTWQKTRLRLVS